MLDLQKAFNTVNHSILLKKQKQKQNKTKQKQKQKQNKKQTNKLKAMGLESVEWFQSYLSNRTQVVNIGKSFSEPVKVTCGVPQRSLLGPLLFLCYINDMDISVDSDCKLLL